MGVGVRLNVGSAWSPVPHRVIYPISDKIDAGKRRDRYSDYNQKISQFFFDTCVSIALLRSSSHLFPLTPAPPT